MAEKADMKKTEDTPKAVNRRKFIQGVIAGGAGVSSATYLFRASGLATAAGASERRSCMTFEVLDCLMKELLVGATGRAC